MDFYVTITIKDMSYPNDELDETKLKAGMVFAFCPVVFRWNPQTLAQFLGRQPQSIHLLQEQTNCLQQQRTVAIQFAVIRLKL